MRVSDCHLLVVTDGVRDTRGVSAQDGQALPQLLLLSAVFMAMT